MAVGLNGRVAVVTGGSRGIGYAVADALAGAGAAVAIGSRNASGVEKAARAISDRHGVRAIGAACDVRSQQDCEQLVARTVSELGSIDVLVNNAGIGRFANVEDMSADDWHAVIETNLNGVFYTTHAALPHLRSREHSWIINIGSLAGKNAFVRGAAYNASKFGLLGFSEALMLEVRNDGVRVCCVMPGSVATEFSHPGGPRSEAWMIQPEDIAQIVMDLIAMPARTLPSRIEVRPSQPK